jgi:hypothetical protein
MKRCWKLIVGSLLTVAVALTAALFFLQSPVKAENSQESEYMYRLYNVNSGEHFYTASADERDYLYLIGWSYEGVGWIAPETSNIPVYRLYNPNAGDHHYTLNEDERIYLISVGWRYEGIGWYSDEENTVPLYRQYNPNAKTGTHNYTVDKKENNFLVSIGWNGEGIGWYGTTVQPAEPARELPAKPTPTPEPKPTVTPNPTPTPEPKPTVTPNPTPTPEPKPTVTPNPTPTPSGDTTESVYVGNVNSKIFHRPTCPSVKRMKEQNKRYFANRESALGSNYTPCKDCRP